MDNVILYYTPANSLALQALLNLYSIALRFCGGQIVVIACDHLVSEPIDYESYSVASIKFIY